MKLDELIKELQELKEEHGNLDVYWYYYNSEYDEETYIKLNHPFVDNVGFYENGTINEKTYENVVLLNHC